MQKHPRNTEFTWVDHTGPLRFLSEEQARDYDRNGYLILEDAFTRETVASLIEELDPLEAEFEGFLREKLGGKAFIARADEITFSVHPVLRSPRAEAFTRHSVFQGLVHDLIGPDVRLYWDQAVYKKPGTADRFPWHQDNGYTYIEPQQYLTCWVALTDTDEENGCPLIAPGLHREGTYQHTLTDLGFEVFSKPPSEPVTVPLRAGSVAVFSSLTPHMTGPNLSTDRLRKAYIVQFAPDGATTVANGMGAESETTCDAEGRQYPVLVDGAAPT
ncbi:MAG: phytanoyl-CoA dioxygenase family protein [Myxococcota bacterium]|nr:phytanoyl-CoA dioxygenase family protein [Myxococcota bacterium]